MKGKRPKRKIGRVPYRGYYLIYVDTQETEKNYLHGIKDEIPDDSIVIKVKKTDTNNLVELCLQDYGSDPQYRQPWIVLDKDLQENFDQIIKEAQTKKISIAWSNPCIEIWFSCYFDEMPAVIDSIQCCKKFSTLFRKKTGKDYSKSDKEIYNLLTKYGDETKAIMKARNQFNKLYEVYQCSELYSKYIPCTTMHELVDELKCKIKEANQEVNNKKVPKSK